jgi:hypothetical protein
MTAPNVLNNAIATRASIQMVAQTHLAGCPLCQSPDIQEMLSCVEGTRIAADLNYAEQTINGIRERQQGRSHLRLVE